MADINEREKKTPEQIKQRILEVLNDKPLNAQEISKAINSNWSTVKEYIEDLIKNEKVKEIRVGDKISYYQKITDTYYNIPIREEQRNILKFIFSNAIKIHKEFKKEQIKRTELAKLSADVNSELNLKLPIVWYIYGPMPLMIIDIQRDYSVKKIPNNSEKILDYIKTWIKKKTYTYVSELKVEYYQKVNNGLYKAKEDLYVALKKGDFSNIFGLTRDFYLKCLTYKDHFSELVDKFYDIISGLDYLDKINKDVKIKNQIFLTFDSLWKYAASKMLYDSILSLGYSKEEADNYLAPAIETKKYLAIETLRDLDEEYAAIIPNEPIEIKEDEIGKKIAGVMQEWLESKTWRENGKLS